MATISPPTPDKHKPAFEKAKLMEEARKRFKLALDWWSENNTRYREAMAFIAGEQWDKDLKAWREANYRPCLVMDRLGTHINQAVNDIRQSKPAIKTHPAGGQATVEVAEVVDGVIRNVEYTSTAPQIYVGAAFGQIAGGQGAWRVLTRYVDERSFEQEMYIDPIDDPTSVLPEPGTDPTGKNARWLFVVSKMSKDSFKDEHPNASPESWGGAIDSQGWWGDNEVRVAEYYRIVNKQTRLYLLDDGRSVDADMLAKLQTDAPIGAMVPAPQVIDERDGELPEVQWFKLGGNEVVDSRIVPCKYIPVVKVVGNCVLKDGKPIVTGLTHRAMDAQRMYNYQTSVVVEILSLQKTAPWVGAVGQFESKAEEWDNANMRNPVRLEYDPIEVNGILAPPPKREAAPQVPTGNVQAMQMAADDLQWITGQHAANMGAKSNETSGRAILARQREGDTATYHYLDNLSNGILQTGRILIDMMPRVMDTKRILRIIGEDGTSKMVEMDPSAQQPVQKVETPKGKVKKIFNLNLGKYDVTVTVGPSFGTKRIEAVEAMNQLLSGNPELWQAIGDLYIGNQDWPGAQDMAKRLRKLLPPQLQEQDGEDPEQALQAQIGEMQQALQQADVMMQQRDAALQQASQIVDQLQAEVEKLKTQVIDMKSSNDAASTAAQAEVRVAEINAAVEALRAMQEAVKSDYQQLAKLIEEVIGERKEADDEAKAETDAMEAQQEKAESSAKAAQVETLLARLAEGQVELQGAAQALLRAVNQPRKVSVERDDMGNLMGLSSIPVPTNPEPQPMPDLALGEMPVDPGMPPQDEQGVM